MSGGRDCVRGAANKIGLLTPGQAGQICAEFAGMLATIHGLDVGVVGLAGFGKPEGYMARQLARWQRQWDLSVTQEMPGYAELVSRLAEGLPAEGGPVAPRAGGSSGTLVHGDFRIDNMLIRPEPEPEIAAVVDWEMSTLGDPLADLGLSLVYWIEPGEEDLLSRGVGESVTTGAGFITRDQIAARYAAHRPRPVGSTGTWRSAVSWPWCFGNATRASCSTRLGRRVRAGGTKRSPP
jgi:aminoglycoside phosphotransferase (APT) family kinase protein